MIVLGADIKEKNQIIFDYCQRHLIKKTVILSPRKFFFECDVHSETVEWADIIEYPFFYRLLQEIDSQTLVVVNECLRLQNRHDLTYNCIRHYLNRTGHQIVFQYLPMIDELQDFMTLVDFDTQSAWKRERFYPGLLDSLKLEIKPIRYRFNPIEIKVSEKLQAEYLQEKRKLIENLGLKDPHTVPRNLYLLGGKAKLSAVNKGYSLFNENHVTYIGRNNRFKIEEFQTYKEDHYQKNYTVFEFPHNFIDFSTFGTLSKQTEFDVLVTDLKVEKWYLERYQNWSERIENAYTSLQQK